MPEPLVSIVTPSYNQGRFIEETIRSVLDQTYPNIEYIIKDGGSTDQTLDVIRQFADSLTYTSKPDNGQSEAINEGLREAKGTYLAYLNSDDTIEPNAIAAMVAHLQANPGTDVVYAGADFVDEGGDLIEPYPTRPFNMEVFRGQCFICQPATLWRRATMERFGEFRPDLHYSMDYEFWLRIAVNGGRLDYLPVRLATSRLYAEAKSLAGKMSQFDEIDEISRRLFHRRHPFWVYQRYRHVLAQDHGPLARLPGGGIRNTMARLLAAMIAGLPAPIGSLRYLAALGKQ